MRSVGINNGDGEHILSAKELLRRLTQRQQTPPQKRVRTQPQEIIVISDDEGDNTRVPTAQETPQSQSSFYQQARRENAKIAQHAQSLMFVNASVVFEEAHDFIIERHASFFETLVPVERHRMAVDLRYRLVRSDGDTILSALESDFDNFPMKRSYLQRLFHKLLLNVTAPLFYGEGTKRCCFEAPCGVTDH
jgi:hypothetical protein